MSKIKFPQKNKRKKEITYCQRDILKNQNFIIDNKSSTHQLLQHLHGVEPDHRGPARHHHHHERREEEGAPGHGGLEEEAEGGQAAIAAALVVVAAAAVEVLQLLQLLGGVVAGAAEP